MAGKRIGLGLGAILSLAVVLGSMPQSAVVAAGTPGPQLAAAVATAAPPVTRRVNIFGRRFEPQTLRVPVGSTIVWRNGDRVRHTVTGNIFRNAFGQVFDIAPPTVPPSPLPRKFTLDSGLLAARPVPAFPGAPRGEPGAGSFFQFTFLEEGTYSYRCTLYGGMAGTILVGTGERRSGSGGGSGPPIGTPVPIPTPLTNGQRLITTFGNRFRPDKVTVNVGTVVRWRDGDRKDHDVIGSTFRDANGTFFDWSPNPDPLSGIPPAPIPTLNGTIAGRPVSVAGDRRPESPTLNYTFTEPGSYTYRGELSQLRGTIVVVTPTPIR